MARRGAALDGLVERPGGPVPGSWAWERPGQITAPAFVDSCRSSVRRLSLGPPKPTPGRRHVQTVAPPPRELPWATRISRVVTLPNDRRAAIGSVFGTGSGPIRRTGDWTAHVVLPARSSDAFARAGGLGPGIARPGQREDSLGANGDLRSDLAPSVDQRGRRRAAGAKGGADGEALVEDHR